MIPLPLALFFYGGLAVVFLLIIFTLGAIFEHRRCRMSLATREEVQRAEMDAYQRGIKHGYYRAVRDRQRGRASCDVDHEG